MMEWIVKKLTECCICKNNNGRCHELFVIQNLLNLDRVIYEHRVRDLCHWCYKTLVINYSVIINNDKIGGFDVLQANKQTKLINAKFLIRNKLYMIENDICVAAKCDAYSRNKHTYSYDEFIEKRSILIDNQIMINKHFDVINTIKSMALYSTFYFSLLPNELIIIIINFIQMSGSLSDKIRLSLNNYIDL